MKIPINALRPKINTNANENPAGINIGVTFMDSIVNKKLILANRIYNKVITITAIGVDLNIEGYEYNAVNDFLDFITSSSICDSYSKLIRFTVIL